MEVAHDLGVWLDSELTTKQHSSKVTRVCYYQFRHQRHIRPLVGQDVTARLVLILTVSQLDYCY
jgi:hypothetical protein